MNSGVFVAENRANINSEILYADGGGDLSTNSVSYNKYNSFANAKFGSGIFVNDTGATGSTITLINKESGDNTDKHASIGFVNTDAAHLGKFGGQIGFWPEITNASKQQFRIYTSGYGNSAGYHLPVQQMVVTSEGNVGIGTTTPASLLDVNGTSRLRGNTYIGSTESNIVSSSDAPLHVSKYENSDNNIIEILKLERRCEDIFPQTGPGTEGTLEARNAEGGYIGLYVKDENNDGESSGVYYVNSELARISWRADNQYNYEGDGRLGFWTSKKTSSSRETYGIHERMTITRDGYVGIGTTFPSCLLDVSGGNFHCSGNITYTGDLTDTSDDRLKHNETDISNALQHIRQLHPKHYIKTSTMYDADHHFDLDASGQPINSSGNPVDHFIQEGLIAQDLLQIDAFKPFVSVPTDPITKPYSVNYNSIFVHAIAALQELDAEHTKTKTELEQTKQSLTETKTELESLLQSALSRITSLETQSTS